MVKGSITDENLITSIIKEVDAVINFAAETHVDRSISNPEPFLLSNTLGTFTLLEATRKANIKRFLQVSTDEIYGTAYGTQSFKEGQTLNPSNPYSASKAAADMYVTAYHRTYGLQTVITRSTNNFGPYQFPEKFIPKTIIRTLKNVPVPIYGSGKQTRNWIYVTDHCRALELVLNKGRPGEIYNISTNNEIENLQVAHSILQLLHKPEKLIHFVEDRPGHDIRYCLDSSKIRSEIGWEPKLSFSQALKSTVEWYQNNEWWWKPIAKEEILQPTPWKSGTIQ